MLPNVLHVSEVAEVDLGTMQRTTLKYTLLDKAMNKKLPLVFLTRRWCQFSVHFTILAYIERKKSVNGNLLERELATIGLLQILKDQLGLYYFIFFDSCFSQGIQGNFYSFFFR